MADQFKPIISATDMDEDLLKKVIDVTYQAMSQFRQEKQIAHYVKYEFDKSDPYGWNCIVGRNFGSHIVHQTKKYVFYKVKELNFLLWKA